MPLFKDMRTSSKLHDVRTFSKFSHEIFPFTFYFLIFWNFIFLPRINKLTVQIASKGCVCLTIVSLILNWDVTYLFIILMKSALLPSVKSITSANNSCAEVGYLELVSSTISEFINYQQQFFLVKTWTKIRSTS